MSMALRLEIGFGGLKSAVLMLHSKASVRFFRISSADLSVSQHSLEISTRVSAARAITIGNFDGVHRGHQALLAALTRQAGDRGLVSCAISFEPHPREFFAKQNPAIHPAPRITSIRNKLLALSEQKLDEVAILRFNAKIAAMPPEDFVRHVLLDRLRMKYLLIGDDFRFGKGRAGDFELLKTMSCRYKFGLDAMPTIKHSSQRVSSTLVREILNRGDFESASSLLERPYSISGRVIHGRKLGRQLGFPTMNISVGQYMPALHGIYVVTVHNLEDRPIPAVASLGTRPAIETNGRYLLEVHCLDWQGDAYGKAIRVEFHHKLRDELPYSGLEPLVNQIRQDVVHSRLWFAENQ